MAESGSTPIVKNVVLVHGAFADGSSWSKVIPLLQAKGFRVTAVGNPLTSFADDLAATKRAIAAQEGPTVLVGHSYAGVVITEAGNDPKVVSLVYVAAYAPDAGQTIGEISKAFPKPAGLDQLQPQADGYLLLSAKGIQEDFAQDLTPSEKALLVATQLQTNGSIFEAKPGAAAWRRAASAMAGAEARRAGKRSCRLANPPWPDRRPPCAPGRAGPRTAHASQRAPSSILSLQRWILRPAASAARAVVAACTSARRPPIVGRSRPRRRASRSASAARSSSPWARRFP